MDTLALFPLGTRLDEKGELWLGGCLASSLAREFGTPLYVFDEATLRARCQEYRQALAQHYPGTGQVAYASKATLNLALAQLFAQEGLDIDVVSGGELYVARQAGFPAERIHFHGNNKTPAELAMALSEGVGRIVVDNSHELDVLERLAAERQVRVSIWLRISPSIDVHTHVYRKTGLLDSKFGFPLETDAAEDAVVRVTTSPHLELVGLHVHIGSQIFDLEPFSAAVALLVDFAVAMRARRGFQLRELSPGGGWGVPHHEAGTPASVDRYVQAVGQAVLEECRRHDLALPTLVIEPGRSIVAQAGVALYRVGARKEIPGVRTYVSVDGGMADNIRPALYGARYTAVAVGKAGLPVEETVTVAGRFCESGDVLIRDIALPRLAPGDLLAVPMVGAYCLPLASNYNLVPRPAVVLVRDGQANLIQRRETFQDLTARDLPISNTNIFFLRREPMSNIDKLKSQVMAEVDARRDELIRISDAIHANPELAFQEFEAAALLTSVLEREGFAVQRGVAGLDTAFVASYAGQKGGRPVVALLSEYDALTDLGHACGHNIIGTASVGAALVLRPILDEIAGVIQVIGTPAEEGGAGKVIMAEAGVFDGVDAAMMVHPSTRTMTRRDSLACYELKMEFFGQSAHAAGGPDKGINALDACVLTYNNISALRQQLADDVRVHGIITHGGSAPNIIPDYTTAEFLVRAAEKDDALTVLDKVEKCAQAGALAAGAEVKLTRGEKYYANMVPNPVLANLFDANLTALGRQVQLPPVSGRMGSTDMGNVSHAVPALHPYIAIAPEEVAGHSPEFRAAAVSPEGHAGLLDAAKALAMTAVDLFANPAWVDAAWQEYRARFD